MRTFGQMVAKTLLFERSIHRQQPKPLVQRHDRKSHTRAAYLRSVTLNNACFFHPAYAVDHRRRVRR